MNLSTRLSNVQLELFKLYSTDLSPEDFHDLKLQLAGFYANRAIKVVRAKRIIPMI